MPLSSRTSSLPNRYKGAATAAFLLVLLVAVLPFLFSSEVPASGSVPIANAATAASNGGNVVNVEGSVEPPELGTAFNLTHVVQTEASLGVQPNPVAVGDTVLFTLTVSPSPPTSNDMFGNLTLLVARPDGTAEVLGPFESEPNGRVVVNYTPGMIGSYSIQLTYGGQFFASSNITYLGALSLETALVVSSDEIPRIGRTWIVDDDGPADFHTIQAAINAADDGDTVRVLNGVYHEHVVVNKTLTVQTTENAVVDASGDPGGVVKPTIARWNGITIMADSCAVTGFTVRNGANSGIEIKADDCIIRNNTCEGSPGRGGISLYGEPEGYTDISRSIPKYNLIINNRVRKCLTGLFADDAHYNNVTQNVFEANEYAGIYLLSLSSDNTLTNNTISRSTHTWSGEGGYGVIVGTGSENNIFTENTISNNPNIGLKIDIFGMGYPYPHSNRVYHNNFYDNAIQACDTGENNAWDDGYPSGGNYWSNYHEVDANGDGIGDTAYVIDANNQDRYPLMHPFNGNVLGPKTWTVDDDSPADFHTIQEAINAASNGDTVFVRSGTYQENVVVNKSLSVTGESASRVVITPKVAGIVVTITVSRVAFEGFRIQGSGDLHQNDYIGIYFANPNASSSIVRRNSISANGYGVSLSGFQNTIEDNSFADNHLGGILVNKSSNNLLIGNNVACKDSMFGIFIAEFSYNNILRNNSITGSDLNLHIFSYDLKGFIQDIDASNTVNGKPVYYWINKYGQVVPPDAGAVCLINCSAVTVQGLEIEHNGAGVLLAYSKNCVVEKNHITFCSNGIRLESSSNSIIRNNDIYEPENCGIAVVRSSSNTVYNNKIRATTDADGLFVFTSSGNQFYHNNLSCIYQVWTENYTNIYCSRDNTWDNGYSSGGNYWSNYNGTDVNHDGIGDTPYVIDADDVDHYPLMNPPET